MIPDVARTKSWNPSLPRLVGIEALSDASFPKSAHLRKPDEFRAVYDHRCKAGDGHLLIFARRNELGETRCGLSVSRKQHGCAVKRNRIKRLLREAFRLSRSELPVGLDLILIPRRASGAGIADYKDSICRLAQRLHKRA